MYKENTWYKVYYKWTAYNGKEYVTFDYALGNKQIAEIEEKHKADETYIETKEWIID